MCDDDGCYVQPLSYDILNRIEKRPGPHNDDAQAGGKAWRRCVFDSINEVLCSITPPQEYVCLLCVNHLLDSQNHG